MASPEMLGKYSQAGFFHSPVCKCLLSWLGSSHVVLQVPMFAAVQKYLVCQIPHSLRRGDFWRLFTSKIAFLDTKDAMFTLLLVYYFRVFERRYGSRRFSSRLLAAFVIATLLEVVIAFGLVTYFESTPSNAGIVKPAELYSGLLAVGPLSLVFPLFIPFFYEVPKGGSSSLGGLSLSPKVLPYFAGVQLLTSSNANLIAAISGLIAGILIRMNFLWINEWLVIPSDMANFVYRFFGRFIESSAPEGGLMGATLEIQRAQHLEALEQQIIRQQTRYAAVRQRRHGGDDAFAFPRMGGAAAGGRRQGPVAPPNAEPSEDNIRLLVDMGFSRDQVIVALRRSNNDVQVATTVLLQEH